MRRLIYIIGISLTLLRCSGSSQPTVTPAIASLSAYSISDALDYGIQSDGNIYVELDGTFAGSGDKLFSSCLNSGNPQVTMVSDSPTTIIFYIPPANLVTPQDSCRFFVENIPYYSNVSTAIILSTTQNALNISTAVDLGPDTTPSNGSDDIALTGSFSGSANGGDLVFYQCDSSTSFTQAQSATGGGVDNPTEIIVAISTPQNFSSCQFIVSSNNVQSQIFTQ